MTSSFLDTSPSTTRGHVTTYLRHQGPSIHQVKVLNTILDPNLIIFLTDPSARVYLLDRAVEREFRVGHRGPGLPHWPHLREVRRHHRLDEEPCDMQLPQ